MYETYKYNRIQAYVYQKGKRRIATRSNNKDMVH